MYRQILCMLLFAFGAACGTRPAPDPVPVVNLIRELPAAEARPPSGYSVTSYERDARVLPAIAAPVPGRLTVALPIPHRGVFQTAVAIEAADPSAAVRFRVGVSDHRIYEGIGEVTVTGARPGWIDLRADLSPFAGFKWSVFYRPDEVVWRLVLATDLRGPLPARAFWGLPEIVADAESAREYMGRRAQVRRAAAAALPD